VVGRRPGAPGGVERLDIDGRSLGEGFDLPLADPDPGGPFDRVASLVERAPRRLDRGQLGSPYECLPAGRLNAASMGYRLGAPGAR